ncbi:hypothetical protein EI94DRAFT_1755912 [Lactarius quietus]|nr:hypothetical protein EI94DRAFT_1755912 [Lactarius quietus]
MLLSSSRQHTAGATTTKTFAEKAKILKARADKRAERAKARGVKAEEHHKAGNAHFRKGEFREAIAEYEVAIKVNGPTAKYFANMAAAWLKLEEYDAAEQCASRALFLDPKFTKARFRRGQARKGSLKIAAAGIDFATVLQQDPNVTEAKQALEEICVLVKERNDTYDPEECGPSLADPTIELESVSDSSDWNHEGNGFPCSYYNHDGCKPGIECDFSHGPDHKSVRDRLGRNVCVLFLLGYCFGRCAYSHDMTYLPSGRWWESERKRTEVRKITREDIVRENPANLPRFLASIDERIAWKPVHAAKVEEAHVWRNNVMKLEGLGETTDVTEYRNSMFREWEAIGGPERGLRGGLHGEAQLDNFEESEERSGNRGSTEDEVNPEEVCQCQREGIQGPWFGRWWFEDEDYEVCVDAVPR